MPELTDSTSATRRFRAWPSLGVLGTGWLLLTPLQLGKSLAFCGLNGKPTVSPKKLKSKQPIAIKPCKVLFVFQVFPELLFCFSVEGRPTCLKLSSGTCQKPQREGPRPHVKGRLSGYPQTKQRNCTRCSPKRKQSCTRAMCTSMFVGPLKRRALHFFPG